VNVEPVDGVAVSVTLSPELNEEEHVAPQFMPVGDEVARPEPTFETVSVYELTAYVAVTVTLLSGIAKVQFPVPVHTLPVEDQPVNVYPVGGVWVIEISVPYDFEPATVPPIVPPFATIESVRELIEKFAVQVFGPFMVTEPSVQSASPDQLENEYPVLGADVRVTTCP
jgi:hypothetical protein